MKTKSDRHLFYIRSTDIVLINVENMIKIVNVDLLKEWSNDKDHRTPLSFMFNLRCKDEILSQACI